MSETNKPSNPKDLIGSNKLPLHLFPLTAVAVGCLAFLEGALKYGRSNFREVGVRSSIYYDAARRHLDSWFEGENIDPESGIDHLGKALACIAVLIDAKAAGKLNDDRMVKGGHKELVEQLTPMVAALKERHAGKSPKHYTIEDSKHDKTVDPPKVLGLRDGWVCPNCKSTRPFGSITDEQMRADIENNDGPLCGGMNCYTWMRRS